MPTDRVLVEIVTAANMAGIEQAKAGFLGMNIATLGLAAGLGLLVMGGKSMLDISEKMDEADKKLAQSYLKTHIHMKNAFDAWVSANKRYIQDQGDAELALANFVRAGANAKTAMRELNDALDLSVIKGVSMTDAQKLITLALAGNAKGLKTLGITTDEYNKIMKDKHLPLAERQRRLLELIEGKTKDGRKAQSDLKQSTNDLQNSWIELSKKGGPVIQALLKFIVDRAIDFYNAFDNIGKNNQLWSNISDRLVNMARWIHDYIIKPIQDVYALINGGPGSRQGAANSAAAGGKFGTGVGGSGPVKTSASMSTASSIHIHIDQGAYIDGPGIDLLTNAIARRIASVSGH